MKILVVGGGPSGLFFSALLKKRGFPARIVVRDQNPPHATFGFGVTLAAHAMDQFAAADPAFFRALEEESVPVVNQVIRHPEGQVAIDSAFSAISIERLALLKILQARCESEGVDLQYDAPLSEACDLEGFDLVVGADGANSFVRGQFQDAFGTETSLLNNRFAWYGVDHAFDTPTLSFKRYEDGGFVGHYYRYTQTSSTFVAECDAAGWAASGLADMEAAGQRRFVEKVFAEDLGGRALIDNRSVWRRFRVVNNRNWVTDNVALIGDALYTAHFSIGSGTRLAMEDSLALADAVCVQPEDVPAALQAYQASRRASKASLAGAARKSYLWYEAFAGALDLHPLDFAYSYMTRTGRMSPERLREAAPRFMAALEAHWKTSRAALSHEGGRS